MSTGTGSDLLHAEDDGVDQIVAGNAPVAARSPLQLFWRRFRRDKVALTALVFIVLLILMAIFAPLIRSLVGAPDPSATSTEALDDLFGLPTGPSSTHLFGVDDLGRDIFARVLDGARVSLLVAFIGTGLSVIIGVTMGMIAGFFRGWVDTSISRVIDILLAVPVLLLGLGLASACSTKEGCLGGTLQPGLTIVIFIIVLSNWPYVARIIRGQVLSLREKEFVEASKSLGAANGRIIFREILPNLVAPIIVYASLFIPANILLEASLSFLGVGVNDQPSWGQMLAQATSQLGSAWWFMFFPGMALVLTVLAFNLVGDGLQDALNPKGNRQK